MSDAPERICMPMSSIEQYVFEDLPDTEYVRADLFQALEAERDALRDVVRMIVELNDNNENAYSAELWDSWMEHPGGYRAARAALQVKS